MQKQKTIAKWLAVILLVTVALACYIVLDATVLNGNSNQNVADAKQDDSTPDIDRELPSNANPTTPILPVYSKLPRDNENINGMQVAHIGGEGQENLLDVVVCFGKTLVIFSSESTQYDVKQSGIYIGVLDDMTLTKIVYVCDISVAYLDCVQTINGLLIATTHENMTTLSLFDEDLHVTCQSTLQGAKNIQFCLSAQGVTAFLYDGRYLKCAYINSSLDVTIANHTFECASLKIKSIIQYGSSSLIFCNHDDGLSVLTYAQNKGFIEQNRYDKQEIVQILPIVQSGGQAFVLLTKSEEDYNVISLASDLKQNAIYNIKDAKNATIFQASSGIEIVTDKEVLRLCSHLDFISSNTLEFDDENSGFEGAVNLDSAGFFPIENQQNLLGIFSENRVYFYEKQDNKLRLILQFYTDKIPLFLTGKNLKNQQYVTLFFNSNSQNSFAYMCFGKFDVFAISLLTT